MGTVTELPHDPGEYEPVRPRPNLLLLALMNAAAIAILICAAWALGLFLHVLWLAAERGWNVV